jgi:hypothetical protein
VRLDEEPSEIHAGDAVGDPDNFAFRAQDDEVEFRVHI